MIRDTAKNEICQKIEKGQRYITSLYEALNWFDYSTPVSVPDAPSTLSSYLLSANMLCYLLNERYKEIRVLDDGAIRAVTQPISLKYRDEVINLGKYAIRISANEINFERIDPEVNPSLTQGYLHPHIDRNGKACWGNWWNNEINAFLKSRNYWTLLDKLHNFLTSYNESGWFHPVMFWHSDATKLCKTCWEEVCICQERICVHCKKVIDKSCKCVRCPESNEIIGKDYDEYCRISCEIWDKEKKICKSAQ